MPQQRGNPEAISLGPGYLWYGLLGRIEPTDLVTPWFQVDAGWVALGYTKTGSSFDYQLSTAGVQVAEELDDLLMAPTGRKSSVSFELAQMTATNLQIALNGGTIATENGLVVFEPPDLGEEQRCMLGFEAEDHTERWVWRQALMDGALKITREKGANNATMACQFSLERPMTGAKLFKTLLASPLRD
jgi:hypothetical protein